MVPSGSKILVWVEPPEAYIRLVGRAALEGARDFKALVRRLDHEGIRRFCLDLQECKIMDSTFSGVLAALATDLGPLADEPNCSRFVLVGPNERVRDLLDNLGVLPLVAVVSPDGRIDLPGPAEELVREAATKEQVAECCLEAHRFLEKLHPENRARFAEVTRLLEQQLQSSR